jgi:pimeloyl-ACP methyl ester carboxylesterase
VTHADHMHLNETDFISNVIEVCTAIPQAPGAAMAERPQWLLLHGTPLTPAVWHDVAMRLREHGTVTAPDLGRIVSSGNVQRALAEQMLANASGEFHLVGHSFGGQVALEMCLAAPERVLSMTGICTRDTPFPAFAAVADLVAGSAPVDVEGGLVRWFRPHELQAAGPVVRYARHCLENADRQLWAQALRAIATYDSSAAVASIEVPFTAIAAQLDAVSTPEAMTAMAARVRHGRTRVLPGAAHMSPFVDPDALAALVLSASTL